MSCMRFCVPLAAFALYLALSALPARTVQAAEPLLTVLFTGNTYGNHAPCPT